VAESSCGKSLGSEAIDHYLRENALLEYAARLATVWVDEGLEPSAEPNWLVGFFAFANYNHNLLMAKQGEMILIDLAIDRQENRLGEAFSFYRDLFQENHVETSPTEQQSGILVGTLCDRSPGWLGGWRRAEPTWSIRTYRDWK
jgi:hypothetical protein